MRVQTSTAPRNNLGDPLRQPDVEIVGDAGQLLRLREAIDRALSPYAYEDQVVIQGIKFRVINAKEEF